MGLRGITLLSGNPGMGTSAFLSPTNTVDINDIRLAIRALVTDSPYPCMSLQYARTFYSLGINFQSNLVRLNVRLWHSILRLVPCGKPSTHIICSKPANT